MKTICGIDCNKCNHKNKCKGCFDTNGKPFGGKCVIAECYKAGGKLYFIAYKKILMEEFNSLGIADMAPITTLCPLCGKDINSEYVLPNGVSIKLLDDAKIYLGNQVKKMNSDKYYGLATDNQYLLVCEYGDNGTNPEIIVYKKRQSI